MFRGIEHINLNTKEPQKVRIKIELKLNLKVKEIRLEKKQELLHLGQINLCRPTSFPVVAPARLGTLTDPWDPRVSPTPPFLGARGDPVEWAWPSVSQNTPAHSPHCAVGPVCQPLLA
jgi:hypothetical protein